MMQANKETTIPNKEIPEALLKKESVTIRDIRTITLIPEWVSGGLGGVNIVIDDEHVIYIDIDGGDGYASLDVTYSPIDKKE